MLRNILRRQSVWNATIQRCLNTREGPSPWAYVQNIGQTPLIYDTMGRQLKEAAEKYSNNIAIKSPYDGCELTFAQVYEEASLMALKLSKLGLEPGEHIALWAPNTIQWYLSFLATALGGFALVCVNPVLQKPELAYALNKSKTRTIITMDEYGKCNFKDILKQLDVSDLKIIMKSQQQLEGLVNYDQWLGEAVSADDLLKSQQQGGALQPESRFLVQFSSGTTGQPKATLISHFNMVNQAVHIGKSMTMDEHPKSICLQVPMFHAFGLSVMAAAIKYGCTICLPSPSFNAVSSLETIERERCEVIMGTPTMFVDLIEKQMQLKKKVDSIRLAFVGGSASSPEVITRTKQIFSSAHVRVGYGLSEATGAVMACDGSETGEEALSTCGRIYEHCEAKIIGDDGRTLRRNEVGELCLRGWATMLGYFEDPANTAKTLDYNGWLRTGDQFSINSNGILQYHGRKKDIIVRGGENIFPKEIEDFIAAHPDVLEAQVIGIPDHRLGEEVCIYLRLSSNSQTLTLEDINDFCKGRLAHFKIPRHLRIVEDFPKTTSGKIQKFKLQEMFAAEK